MSISLILVIDVTQKGNFLPGGDFLNSYFRKPFSNLCREFRNHLISALGHEVIELILIKLNIDHFNWIKPWNLYI